METAERLEPPVLLTSLPGGKLPTRYAELMALFSPEERSMLAQFKRFCELYEGDKYFRAGVKRGHLEPEQQKFLRKVGVTFSLDEVATLWEDSEAGRELTAAICGSIPFSDLSAETRAVVDRSPVLQPFARFNAIKALMCGASGRVAHNLPTLSPEYNAWRLRRIAATKSELGSYGRNIDHPVLAIELCVGCSVGCYFCAFDAPRLSRVFDYEVPENRELFRGVAGSLSRLLGNAAGHGLLYWSTEPHDNPHYIDFMKDYKEVTGVAVCTSTARWNEDWIRNLIKFYRAEAEPWPRISVLSRKIMHRLFEQFTPDEFRDVWLLPQQKDGEEARKKVPGGRAKMMKILVESKDQRDYAENEVPDEEVLQGSIACVSGILVNMIERTIQLISPCYTTEKYRYGYRVFSKASFETVEDFDREIRNIFTRKMLVAPYGTMPMRFRDDLEYRPKDNGFVVVSPNHVHRFEGSELLKHLGDLIANGDLDYRQLNKRLLVDHGLNPMEVSAAIKRLFDRGFLDEVDVENPSSVH
jgi:radical SAM family RiPP maturation amino acid epimerase